MKGVVPSHRLKNPIFEGFHGTVSEPKIARRPSLVVCDLDLTCMARQPACVTYGTLYKKNR